MQSLPLFRRTALATALSATLALATLTSTVATGSVIFTLPGVPILPPHVAAELVADGSGSASPYWIALAGRSLPTVALLTLGTGDTITASEGNPVRAVSGRSDAASALQIDGGSIDAHTVMPPDDSDSGICCIFTPVSTLPDPMPVVSAPMFFGLVTLVPVLAVGGVRTVTMTAGSIAAHSGLLADAVGIALPDAVAAQVNLNGGTLQVRVDGSDLPATGIFAVGSPVAIGIGSLPWSLTRGAGSVLVDGGTIDVHLEATPGYFSPPAAAGIADIAHVQIRSGSIDVSAVNGFTWGISNAHDLRIDGGSITSRAGIGASAETVVMHGGTLSGSVTGLALLPSAERSLTIDGGTIRAVSEADPNPLITRFGVDNLHLGTFNGGRIEAIASAGTWATAAYGAPLDFSDPFHPQYDGGALVLAGTQLLAQTTGGGTASGIVLIDDVSVHSGSVTASADGVGAAANGVIGVQRYVQDGGSITATAVGNALGVDAGTLNLAGGTISADSTGSGLASAAIVEQATLSGGGLAAHGTAGDATALAGWYADASMSATMTGGTLTATTDAAGTARGLHRLWQVTIAGGSVTATASGSGAAIGVDAVHSLTMSGGRIS